MKRARTSQSPASKLESQAPGLVFGQRCTALLASYDPDLQSLKTSQTSLGLGLIESSLTLPLSGMMRSGNVYQQEMLVRHTLERESGLLPTPTATDWKRTPMTKYYANKPLTMGTPDTLAQWAARGCGAGNVRLVPDLWEWIMGLPMKWTALKDSATPSSPKLRKS